MLWLIYTALTAAQTIILNAVGFLLMLSMPLPPYYGWLFLNASGGLPSCCGMVCVLHAAGSKLLCITIYCWAGCGGCLKMKSTLYLKLVVVATLLLVGPLPLDTVRRRFSPCCIQVSSVVTTRLRRTDLTAGPLRLLLLLLMFVGGCGGSLRWLKADQDFGGR